MKRLSFLPLVVVLSGPAQSAPPPVGSEQYELLHPYSEWIERAHSETAKEWCCTIADGRVVEARLRGDRWQVRFPRDSGVDAPFEWMDVPDGALVRGKNPVGLPIAWWYLHTVRCFCPPGGV